MQPKQELIQDIINNAKLEEQNRILGIIQEIEQEIGEAEQVNVKWLLRGLCRRIEEDG